MKTFRKKIIPVTVTAVAIFDAAFFFAERAFWSGIHSMTGANWLAPLLFTVMTLLAAASLILLFVKPVKLFYYIAMGFAAAFLILDIFIFSQVSDMIRNILTEFGITLIVLCAAAIVIFWLFFYPKVPRNNRTKWYPWVAAFVIVAGVVFAAVPIGHKLTSGAVVYAVEDEYQICFSTSTAGVGWVEIDNNKYFDSVNGTDVTDTAHKVSVPMEKLDATRAYTVYSRKSISKLPYDGINGKTVKKEYSFRPIDLSDGLNYYSVSDNHGETRAAANAVIKCGKQLDFLIIAGDTASYLDFERDFCVKELASLTTNGTFPVIYARGNHEPKGRLAYRLPRYVGCTKKGYYYNVRLGAVWLTVLDLGEDHNDDWWEYYGTANYNAYRSEQLTFLDETIADNDYMAADIAYRIAVCHIPPSVVTRAEYNEAAKTTSSPTLADFKKEMTEKLNNLNLDIAISGHRHQLMCYTTDIWPNTELLLSAEYAGHKASFYDSKRLNANFPTFIVGRRSDNQSPALKENLFKSLYTGMLASFNGSETNIVFTDCKGKTVKVISPFENYSLPDNLSVPHPPAA